MGSKSVSADYPVASSSATTPRVRTSSKPSVLKCLTKLVTGAQSGSLRKQSSPKRTTPTAQRLRRAEALRKCGLLKQSVKYGGPYRDEAAEDDTKTLAESEKHIKGDAGREKGLLIFEENEYDAQEKVYVHIGGDKELIPVCSPMTPPAALSKYSDSSSTTESDSSTLAPGQPPVQMRRIGSITAELDQIEDDESRRLTEVAFLC